MKLLRIASAAVAISMAAVLGSSVAFASSPGRLGGGPNVYEVKDVTSGGSYGTSITAACGDTVQFSATLDNGGYGGLTNVVVKATLPTSSSTSISSAMTATPAEGAKYGTNGTATVNYSSAQTLAYINGSTKLLDVHGNVIQTLGDTVTTSGINVGNIAGSTTEFVNFQAKTTCPTTPPTPPTPPTPASPKPAALPNTGPGDVIGAFAGASTVGTLGHYFISRRRR